MSEFGVKKTCGGLLGGAWSSNLLSSVFPVSSINLDDYYAEDEENIDDGEDKDEDDDNEMSRKPAPPAAGCAGRAPAPPARCSSGGCSCQC